MRPGALDSPSCYATASTAMLRGSPLLNITWHYQRLEERPPSSPKISLERERLSTNCNNFSLRSNPIMSSYMAVFVLFLESKNY